MNINTTFREDSPPETNFHARIRNTHNRLLEFIPSLRPDHAEPYPDEPGSGMADPVTHPKTALILGSGFSLPADRLKGATRLPYESIPGFPAPTVEGHSGELTIGSMGSDSNNTVIVFGGRYHTYEGYSAFETTYPVLTAKALGVRTLITTSAAGSLNRDISPGDIMIISDHINLLPDNPLKGIQRLSESMDNNNEPALIDFSIPFQDMTAAYDPELREKARNSSVLSREGILAVVPGPSYETPAEIRMLRMMGADAVCMSTAPEVIMARYLGMRVLGISMITNYATGMDKKRLSHDEVLNTGAENIEKISTLLTGIIS